MLRVYQVFYPFDPLFDFFTQSAPISFEDKDFIFFLHLFSGTEARMRNIEKENLQLSFLNKQYLSQTRKLETECLELSRRLRSIQSCGACRCLAGKT